MLVVELLIFHFDFLNHFCKQRNNCSMILLVQAQVICQNLRPQEERQEVALATDEVLQSQISVYYNLTIISVQLYSLTYEG